jgi:hypothetical protein
MVGSEDKKTGGWTSTRAYKRVARAKLDLNKTRCSWWWLGMGGRPQGYWGRAATLGCVPNWKLPRGGVNRQVKTFSTKTRSKLGKTKLISKFTQLTLEMRCCWGLVLKCYELRTRQHKMLNVNVLRPTKHYSLGYNGFWTKVDVNTITKVKPS